MLEMKIINDSMSDKSMNKLNKLERHAQSLATKIFEKQQNQSPM